MPDIANSCSGADTPGPLLALIESVSNRERGADTALYETVYRDLRALAGSLFRDQGAEHTLQPTALVNEACLKLLAGSEASWQGRAHLIAVAAKAMRQILIDHARAKRAEKRGGGAARLGLTGLMLEDAPSEHDAIDLDDALQRLAIVDARQAKVVELRFYAGLKVSEIALVLGVSDRTIEMDWRMARAWLRRDLKGFTS